MIKAQEGAARRTFICGYIRLTANYVTTLKLYHPCDALTLIPHQKEEKNVVKCISFKKGDETFVPLVFIVIFLLLV